MSNVPEPRRPEKRRATKAEHVAFHKEETERQRIQAEEDRIREEQRRLKEEEEARKFQQELNDGILARDLAAQQTEQATKISNLVKEGSKLAKQAVKQAHNSGRLYEPVLTPYQRLVKLKEDKERELQEKAAAKKEEKKQKQLKRLEKKEKKMEEMLRKKALQQAAAAENQEGDGDQDKPKEGNKSTAQDDEEANRRKKHRKKKKAKRRLKKKEEEKKASAIPLYAECNRWTLGKYVIHKEPKKETEDERRQRDYKQYKREFVRPTVPPAPSLPSRVPHLEILCRAKSMMPSLLKIHGINIDKMILDYEKRNGKVPQRPPEGWLPKDHLERMAARTDYKYDPNEKPAFTWHKFYDTPLPSSYPLPRPSTNEELRTEYIYHPSHDGSDVSPDEILPSPQGEDENLPFYSDRPYVFHTYEAFWNEAARAGVPDMLENLFNELIANDHYFNEHIQDEMRKYFKTCASPPTFQQLVDHFKSAAFRLVSVDVKKTLALVVSDLYEKLGNKHKEARNRQEQKWTSESDKRQSDCRKATEQRFRDMSGEWKKARDAVLQKKTEHEEFKRIRQQRRQEIRRQERRQQPDPFQSSEEESDGDPEDDRVSSDEEEVKKNFDKTLENMSKPVPGFEEPEEPPPPPPPKRAQVLPKRKIFPITKQSLRAALANISDSDSDSSDSDAESRRDLMKLAMEKATEEYVYEQAVSARIAEAERHMESSEVDEIEILEQAAASIEAEAAAAQAGPLTEEAAIAHIMNDDWFVDAIGSTPEPGKVGSLVHAAPLSFFGGIGSFIASAEAVNPVQAKEESCKEPEVENDEAVEVAPHQESTAEMQPEFANHEEEEAASRDQPTAEVQPLVVIPAQSEEASRKEPVVEQKQQDEEEPVRKEPAMHKGRRIKVKVLPERPKKVQESRSERVQAAQPEVDAEPETQPEEEPAAEHEQQEEAQPEDQSQAELAIEPQEQQEAQPGEKRKKKGKKSQPQPEEEPEPEPKPSLFNPDQPTMFSFTQTLGYFMAALQTLNLQNLRMAQQEADDFGPRIVELHDDEAVAEATETQAPEGAPVQMPVSALLPPLSQPLFAPFVPTRRVEEPVAAEEIEEEESVVVERKATKRKRKTSGGRRGRSKGNRANTSRDSVEEAFDSEKDDPDFQAPPVMRVRGLPAAPTPNAAAASQPVASTQPAPRVPAAAAAAQIEIPKPVEPTLAPVEEAAPVPAKRRPGRPPKKSRGRGRPAKTAEAVVVLVPEPIPVAAPEVFEKAPESTEKEHEHVKKVPKPSKKAKTKKKSKKDEAKERVRGKKKNSILDLLPKGMVIRYDHHESDSEEVEMDAEFIIQPPELRALHYSARDGREYSPEYGETAVPSNLPMPRPKPKKVVKKVTFKLSPIPDKAEPLDLVKNDSCLVKLSPALQRALLKRMRMARQAAPKSILKKPVSALPAPAPAPQLDQPGPSGLSADQIPAARRGRPPGKGRGRTKQSASPRSPSTAKIQPTGPQPSVAAENQALQAQPGAQQAPGQNKKSASSSPAAARKQPFQEPSQPVVAPKVQPPQVQPVVPQKPSKRKKSGATSPATARVQPTDSQHNATVSSPEPQPAAKKKATLRRKYASFSPATARVQPSTPQPSVATEVKLLQTQPASQHGTAESAPAAASVETPGEPSSPVEAANVQPPQAQLAVQSAEPAFSRPATVHPIALQPNSSRPLLGAGAELQPSEALPVAEALERIQLPEEPSIPVDDVEIQIPKFRARIIQAVENQKKPYKSYRKALDLASYRQQQIQAQSTADQPGPSEVAQPKRRPGRPPAKKKNTRGRPKPSEFLITLRKFCRKEKIKMIKKPRNEEEDDGYDSPEY